jgi:hypothetical protein
MGPDGDLIDRRRVRREGADIEHGPEQFWLVSGPALARSTSSNSALLVSDGWRCGDRIRVAVNVVVGIAQDHPAGRCDPSLKISRNG